MYNDYFGLKEAPFSIAPNPQYLFMSPRHREALAHLLYGIQGDGGFILLSGEVGTGKTTVCRCLLEQIPDEVDTAYILNPKQTAQELLATTCDEFGIKYPDDASIKVLVDGINQFLLRAHQEGRRTVLIIDEAQNLSVDVLEQLRLLTNLETNQRKLLQIILLGQPELLTLLAKQELRQLSQRVTARFHLDALTRDEVADYIQHRLDIAGAKGQLFPASAVNRIYKISKGIPRLINLVCDRALLGTYVQNRLQVDVNTINNAAKEVLGESPKSSPVPIGIAAGIVLLVGAALLFTSNLTTEPVEPPTVVAATDSPQVELPTTNETKPLALLTPVANTKPITNITGYASKHEAFQALMLIWGADVVLAESADPCDVAEVSGLRCLSQLGSLNDVAHLKRPAIVSLPNTTGQQFFLITAMDEATVTVEANQAQQVLDRQEVLELWPGEFTLIWRAPPAYQNEIKMGDQGAVVDWLMTQLAVIEGVPVPSITDRKPFDELLQQRIKRFQLSAGLPATGVVGAETWIHLNSADSSGIPILGKPETFLGDKG